MQEVLSSFNNEHANTSMKSFKYIYTSDAQQATLQMQTVVQDDMGAYRTGSITLDNGRTLPIVCRHSKATSALTYLHPIEINNDWRRLVGLFPSKTTQTIDAPSTLLVGVERARLLTQGVLDLLNTPAINTTIKKTLEEKIALLPVLREGKQFGLTSNIKQVTGYTCAELPVDHPPDAPDTFHVQENVLTGAQRERVELAIVGTGLTKGSHLVTLMNHIQSRFSNLSHIDIIMPHATLLGLTHLLSYTSPGLSLRAHIFETLLDSHNERGRFFPHPEFHISPAQSRQYRAWWGRDLKGHAIANLPHIGKDNSDALFDPLRQIRTLNDQLQTLHQTTLANILARHLTPQ